MPRDEAHGLDAATLGLTTRSDAVREGLRLLHAHAQDVALAQSYDEFYGGPEAHLGEIARAGGTSPGQ